MTLTGIITNKISRLAVGVATVVTAAILAFGGLSPVGAVGEYQCGTYGGGDYNQTDCTEPTTTTPPTTTPQPSSSTPPKINSGTTPPSTSTPDNTVVLNDFSEYTATAGKSLSIKTGDVFYFNLKGDKHTVTVKSFDANTLVVTIASTPTDVSVAKGQTVNHDVDEDGTPDIAITYSGTSSDNASATTVFRALSTSAAEPTPTTTGTSTNTSTGGTTATEKSTNMWWVWIIPIVLGVALLIWALVAAKRRKAASASTGTGSTFNQF